MFQHNRLACKQEEQSFKRTTLVRRIPSEPINVMTHVMCCIHHQAMTQTVVFADKQPATSISLLIIPIEDAVYEQVATHSLFRRCWSLHQTLPPAHPPKKKI